MQPPLALGTAVISSKHFVYPNDVVCMFSSDYLTSRNHYTL